MQLLRLLIVAIALALPSVSQATPVTYALDHGSVTAKVWLNGSVVDERALRSVLVFIGIYVGVFALASVGLVVDARRLDVDIGPFDAMGAVAACLGNIGPAFGFAGPYGSYAPFSDLSTGILAGAMWLGRLEIIPVAVLLSRTYWRA